MDGAAVLFLWLIVSVVAAAATTWFSVRVWKRRSELQLWTKAAALVVAVSAMLGALGTLFGLVKAFGAIGGESMDPSQKAQILAEGISAAMNFTALGIVVWLPSVIALVLLMRAGRTRTDRPRS